MEDTCLLKASYSSVFKIAATSLRSEDNSSALKSRKTITPVGMLAPSAGGEESLEQLQFQIEVSEKTYTKNTKYKTCKKVCL